MNAPMPQTEVPQTVIPLQPVSSSLLHAVGYDPTTARLAVQFKSKAGPGSTYEYANVPPEKYEALVSAPSVGRYFGVEIKAKPEEHPYTKVSSPPQGAAAA